MDANDYLGLLRDLLKVIGGALVAHGAVSEGNVELLSGIAIGVFPILWSHVARLQQKAAMVRAAATGIPVSASVLSPTAPPAADVAVVREKAGGRPFVQGEIR